jgi:Glycosyltransferase family 87
VDRIGVGRGPDLTPKPGWPTAGLCLLAVTGFGLAAQVGVLVPLAGALLGIAGLALGFVDSSAFENRWRVTGLIGLALFAAVWIGDPTYTFFPTPPTALVLGLMVVPFTTGLGLLLRRPSPRLLPVWVWISIILVAVLGAVVIRATDGTGIDVMFLHRQAAHAIVAGESPYGPAVDVPNGSPYSDPGDRIIGYPYPPITLLAFSLGEWLLGDPRWTGWAAAAVVLAVLAARALQTRDDRVIAVAVFLALVPGWPLMLQTGWTEVVSVALLVGSALLWKRPLASSVLLGLAFASKQYFAVAIPFLLFHPMTKGRRSLIAVGVAAITLVPAFLVDPSGAWQAMVVFHANSAPRLDSSNLVGLLASLDRVLDVPLMVTVLAPIGVAWGLKRRTTDVGGLYAGLGLVLSTFFLLTTQTFANYWLLIAGLCAIAMAVKVNATPPIEKAETTSGAEG